jgi:transcriptional regulator with XRE-family HTH domain
MGRKAYRDGYVAAHISNTVAAQIVKLRAAHGWTQGQLAEQAKMKQSRISVLEDPNWENVEIATLRRLASAFDVGLTVRFAPFSELAYWAVTLADHKLFVPTYGEEDEEEATTAQGSAAAAFAVPLSQKPLFQGTVFGNKAQPSFQENPLGPTPSHMEERETVYAAARNAAYAAAKWPNPLGEALQ